MFFACVRFSRVALVGVVLLIPHFARAQSVPEPPTGVGSDLADNCPTGLIDWNASVGATFYQVYVEQAFPPWTGGGLISTVSGTEAWYRYQLGGHPYMFGVAACNASGCSPIATTYSGVSPYVCP